MKPFFAIMIISCFFVLSTWAYFSEKKADEVRAEAQVAPYSLRVWEYCTDLCKPLPLNAIQIGDSGHRGCICAPGKKVQ